MRGELFRCARIVFAAALVVCAFVYVDLVLRARSAYLEGEKYMSWYRDPSLKKAFYEERYQAEKERLNAEKSAGKLAESEYDAELELARFRRNEAVAESSIKYAYHWYKTAADLFTPPESRWVRLSRKKAARARELWKAELDSKKISYEEYMLE